MKKPLPFCFQVILGAFLLAGCSKEVSYQADSHASGPVVLGGTLVGSPGACSNTEVFGIYGQQISLDSTNKIAVDLEVPKAGTYLLSTDTVNGVYFSGLVTATGAGVLRVPLKGYGKAASAGQFTFTVKSNPSACSIVVEFFGLATGTGNDYFPMTANSRWTYKSNDPLANAADTLLQLSTGKSLAIAANTYQLFTLHFGAPLPDSAFFRKIGTDYAELGEIDVSGAGDNASPADFIFLKENAAPAEEWLSPEVGNKVGGNPVKFRLKFKILEKGRKAFVGDMVFDPVIKVRVTQQVQLSSLASWTDIMSYENWYARGIGLINVVAPAPIYGYRVIKFNVY
jgi:hypothetical protein